MTPPITEFELLVTGYATSVVYFHFLREAAWQTNYKPNLDRRSDTSIESLARVATTAGHMPPLFTEYSSPVCVQFIFKH